MGGGCKGRRLGEAQVTADDVEAFRRDGAVCLRGTFDQRWLDVLARGIERNFEDPSPSSMRYTREGGPGDFYDDYCNWQRVDEYREFVFRSPAASIARRLTESRHVRFYHEHVLIKEPGTRETTPWHQDLPYYGLEGTKLCSIWLPLDPVPRANSLEVVAGSHADGRRTVPRRFLTHENYADAPEGYEEVPAIDARQGDHRILSWALEPGDCVVFHMAALHGASGTVGLTGRRRSFSTRWMGDDAVFATRPWETSPPFEGLRLEAGETMDAALFPLVE